MSMIQKSATGIGYELLLRQFKEKYQEPVLRTPQNGCTACMLQRRHQPEDWANHPDAGTGQNKDRRMAGG